MFEGSEFLGQEAASITLGLVGFGRVGREVAARARALGFTLLAYDPLLPDVMADGVDLVPLDTLLERSDIVSLPHIGGATTETLARGAQRAVAALASVLAGQVPDDVMNPQVLKGGSLQRWP